MNKIARFGGSAVVTAGVGALFLRRWKSNPGPHDGRAPVLPEGRSINVPTDDGAEISVGIAGSGPPVVLVHGITANKNDWAYIAERLVAAGHEVFALDQRGHGASTVGTEGFGAPRMGRDIRAVLERFDLSECVLAGHSMGGIAAMSFAVDHPEVLRARVRGLVLVSTTPQTDGIVERVGALTIRADWSVIDAMPNLARVVAGISVFGRPKSLAMIDHVLASARRITPENRIGAAKGLTTYNVKRRVSQIDVPTMVVCGTHDLITPIRHSRFIAKAIARATLHEYPAAGHQIIWERSPEIAGHIIDLAGE